MTPATASVPHHAPAAPARKASSAPLLIRLSNPLGRAALRVGIPMGPNTLLTVRGRTSGVPRTAPVAVVHDGEHRYVIGAYGDVQWVRNLRAAGEGLLRIGRRDVPVTAHELSREEAAEFFGVTLRNYIARFPWFGRAFARLLFGIVGEEVLDDPGKAAETRPVFDLTPLA
jgi:deazaflavin-dependent oxidoreductase (nitroreductase family)